MPDYFTERDRDRAERQELKKAKGRLGVQQQPILRPFKVKTLSRSPQYQSVEKEDKEIKKRKKRRKRRPVSTKVAKSIRKAERQATSVLRDTSPNVVGLRRTPRRAKGRYRPPRRAVSETLADERDSKQIIDEFLS